MSSIKRLNSNGVAFVMTKGRAFPSGSFLLKAIKSPITSVEKNSEASCVSFLAPKKAFKTAVIRNRARRRAKAAFQKVTQKTDFPFGLSVIFLLKPEALSIDLTSLENEMELVVKKMYTR